MQHTPQAAHSATRSHERGRGGGNGSRGDEHHSVIGGGGGKYDRKERRTEMHNSEEKLGRLVLWQSESRGLATYGAAQVGAGGIPLCFWIAVSIFFRISDSELVCPTGGSVNEMHGEETRIPMMMMSYHPHHRLLRIQARTHSES